MISLRLARAYLAHRPLESVLALLLVALTVAIAVGFRLTSEQLEQRFARDAQGIDLVIGAKGSPLQLTLAAVYHLDSPTGNISWAEAKTIASDPRIKQAIPLSLGDSIKGFRIVGTDQQLIAHYGATLAAGKTFAQPLELVLGADAALALQAGIGSRLTGTHGLSDGGDGGNGGEAHSETFTVVGVLARNASVLDRLILTPLESVWAVHAHHAAAPAQPSVPSAEGAKAAQAANAEPADHQHEHDHEHEHEAKGAHPPTAVTAAPDSREITAMLLRYATPLAAALLPREINTQRQVQAASPALEVSRLMLLLGGLGQALALLATLLAGFALAAIFVAINANFVAHQRDLSELRLIGARPLQIAGVLLWQAVALAGGGAILGLCLGHASVAVLAHFLTEARQIALTPWLFLPDELIFVTVALLAGLCAAVGPAWRAYRADWASALSA